MTTTTEIAFTGFALSPALATFDELRAFVDQWLDNRRNLKPNSRIAYRRDMLDYLDWCEANGLHPMEVKFTHINAYRGHLEQRVDPRSGRTFGPSTVSRKITSVSSCYTFLVKLGVIGLNPTSAADRPEVDRTFSTTPGLTPRESDRLLAGAKEHSARAYAITAVLLDTGIRVAELCELQTHRLFLRDGIYSILFTGKGGSVHFRVLSETASDALAAYLAERAQAAGCRVDELAGWVFTTASGGPIDRNYITDILRSCAKKAKLACADRITPHWLRHAYVTNAIDAGVPRHIVQFSLRHRHGATTDRYYSRRNMEENDPAKVLDAARRERAEQAKRERERAERAKTRADKAKAAVG